MGRRIAGGVGRNRDSELQSNLDLASLRMLWSVPAASAVNLAATNHAEYITLVAAAAEFVDGIMAWNNDEVYDTKPQHYAEEVTQWLIWNLRNNNTSYFVVESTHGHKASRGLSATAELLVSKNKCLKNDFETRVVYSKPAMLSWVNTWEYNIAIGLMCLANNIFYTPKKVPRHDDIAYLPTSESRLIWRSILPSGKYSRSIWLAKNATSRVGLDCGISEPEKRVTDSPAGLSLSGQTHEAPSEHTRWTASRPLSATYRHRWRSHDTMSWAARRPRTVSVLCWLNIHRPRSNVHKLYGLVQRDLTVRNSPSNNGVRLKSGLFKIIGNGTNPTIQ